MGVAGREDVEDDEQVTEEDESQEEHEGEGESQAEGEENDEGGEGEDEEVVVQIGNEETPASEEEKAAPKWVKDLRQRQRELARENAELKAKLSTGQPAQQGKPDMPQKPKLADYDYDEEKFEQARDAWDAKKREVDAWEANQRQAQEAQTKRAQAVNDNYAATAKALRVKDFQEAEDEVLAVMDEVQQALLKAGPSNPGAMVYALGRNPKRLQELASIKDPVKFAVAVGKLETEVKVTKRTSTKPAPESTVRAGSGSAPSTSATLERLRAEAAKTGDFSKVAAYKKQQRDAGK